MDISETYIKMADCEEIQGQFDKSGLMLVGAPTDNDCIVLGIRSHDIFLRDGVEPIWLPRQDKLQEMVGEKDLLQLVWAFNNFCHDISYTQSGYKTFPTSMEQLWLAFVMQEKFNKVWNGKEWKEG